MFKLIHTAVFTMSFVAATFLFLSSAAMSQTINGDDWSSFRSSVDRALNSLQPKDVIHFSNGLMIAAYRGAGFEQLPSKVHSLLFGMAADQMPQNLAGFETSEIVRLGKTERAINYRTFGSPGEVVEEQRDQLRLLYESSPELAYAFVRRATRIHVSRTCDASTLGSLVFQVQGGPKDLAEQFNSGGVVFRDSPSDYNLTEQGIQANVTIFKPTIGFVTSLNGYGTPVYRLAARASALMHKDTFRVASAQTVRNELPPSTCQDRYRDHDEYFQTVEPDKVSIGNTVTYEKWACGRIKFGIGSKGYKTRLFKTTSSQQISITPITQISPFELGVRINAIDERAGEIKEKTISLANQIGSDMSSLPKLLDTPVDQMMLGATFSEGQAGVEGGDQTPFLALNIHFEDRKLRNALDACNIAAELAKDAPVTLKKPLMLYMNDGALPLEN